MKTIRVSVKNQATNMNRITQHQRAVGTFVGALIGEALAVGPHWYYDLEEQHRDYGPWIDTYTKPRPDRYHRHLNAGDLSQSGILMMLMAHSLNECESYDEKDFCDRIEQNIFKDYDGTPASGPGGYTSQSIREAWIQRVANGSPWGSTAGHADTTEAIERCIPLAVRYANSPAKLAEYAHANTALTQSDNVVQSMTVAFLSVLALLIQGHVLDSALSSKLMSLVKFGELPFHAVTSDNLKPPQVGIKDPSRIGVYASPDALLSPSYMAAAAVDPDIKIEPASKVAIVYGMPCAIYHQLPAAYYLAARFKDDFENSVLHAVNGGGQNQARAMLTGALVGAMNGIDGIPHRFIDGLNDAATILATANSLAKQIE